MGEGNGKLALTQIMTTNPFKALEVTQRTVKRAQYEALAFSLVPGGVRVRNESYANPSDHEYLVEITDSIPSSCTCPADERYEGACKHRVAVAIRRFIVDAAVHQQLVADGGRELVSPTVSDAPEEELQDEEDCDCANLTDDFPCWECYRQGRRDFPSDE